MKITMVKKRLADGEPCEKCQQAEHLLRERGLWDTIDYVVWAEEGDPESPGMLLAAEHKVKIAPFFLIHIKKGETLLFRSALRFAKEVEKLKANQPNKELLDTAIDVDALSTEFAEASPQQVVKWILGRFGETCAIAFSGAEDVVLIDMAARFGLDFSVFCLDTGRLHPETYQFIDKVRKHYDIEIRLMSPDAQALEAFVLEKGLFSFYEDGHKECCGIRKVAPLRRALSSYRAWITGQRRDQSPTRAEVEKLQWDPAFEGVDGPLLKCNPLAQWTSAQVWQYIQQYEVPYNPLHEKGFISIGCEPCTRTVRPNEHERAGRWWWEESTKRECGLHVAEDE
tara:strand:- start:3564 stop:4583 length:1020 start_codon:yes stop_codon:yes gene_type:complete